MSVAEETQEKPRQLPLFEGHRVTENRVNFSGNNEVGELELLDSLKLGAEVTLIVRGRVVSRGHQEKRDGEGNIVSTISSSNISVSSVTSHDES